MGRLFDSSKLVHLHFENLYNNESPEKTDPQKIKYKYVSMIC